MNDEEKILSLLEKMDGRLSFLEQGQKETNQRLAQIDSRLDSIESDVKRLKKDVRDIKVDLKGVWSDILMLDNRTQGLREIK